ncbi:hypothetical protein OSB04_015759 [Centaurea solstitialis]|uniref:Germin-like protein n=1 Tax=Centaurea solstitialis TaxID=347529 RepID=A0AA38SZN1_9ASTR|nr:hypothetical protein OSB04_015759 [Centaurea solstitialis]
MVLDATAMGIDGDGIRRWLPVKRRLSGDLRQRSPAMVYRFSRYQSKSKDNTLNHGTSFVFNWSPLGKLLTCYGFRSEPSPRLLRRCTKKWSIREWRGMQRSKSCVADDFFFSGLHLMGDTSNAVGSNVTVVTVAQLPGLNTFGISTARIDFAPWGINPPHTHPRATEILTVLEGRIEVGFVTSNPENRLITKGLQKGDVFIFPEGPVHFQRNVGNSNAVVIAALSSQNPGAITIANALFGSNPDIDEDILAKAFQVDKNVVRQIQSKF